MLLTSSEVVGVRRDSGNIRVASSRRRRAVADKRFASGVPLADCMRRKTGTTSEFEKRCPVPLEHSPLGYKEGESLMCNCGKLDTSGAFGAGK